MEIIRRKGNGDNLSLIAQYVKLGRYQEDDHLSNRRMAIVYSGDDKKELMEDFGLKLCEVMTYFELVKIIKGDPYCPNNRIDIIRRKEVILDHLSGFLEATLGVKVSAAIIEE